MTTFTDLFDKLTARSDLDEDEAGWAMDSIMDGRVPPAQIAGFLMSLATKGYTETEVLAFADRMRAHALNPALATREALDIVGTGGDQLHTVNISTCAALVLAGAGVPVIKHGNRASSSQCGSADVMEALGISLPTRPIAVSQAFEQLGITFLFANVFHPAMASVAPVRRELGYPTVFNILGPLTNPARPRAAAVGVSFADAAQLMAGVLARRGNDAVVFRGRDTGLDELSPADACQVWEVHDGRVSERVIAPADLGVQPCTIDDLRGGDASTNARAIRAVLGGTEGPITDAVCMNVAAGLVAYGRHPQVSADEGDLTERLRAGIQVARDTIASHRASQLLERWMSLS